MDEAGAGRRRQNEVYRAGVYGHSPRVPVAVRKLQEAAKKALNARAYAYVAGGAGDEATQRANRAAFDRWAVVPRVLRDVSSRDTSVELFGRRIPAPVLLGPVGALELVHDEATGLAAGTVGHARVGPGRIVDRGCRRGRGQRGGEEEQRETAEHRGRAGRSSVVGRRRALLGDGPQGGPDTCSPICGATSLE